nr:MAG TPA: hypothetical protein [Caudoviricetes sp.]
MKHQRKQKKPLQVKCGIIVITKAMFLTCRHRGGNRPTTQRGE